MSENGRAGASRPHVLGLGLDAATRCAHYGSPPDIVAIRMKCCNTYYACKDCHAALADHALRAWPQSEWDELAVLCGACGTEMNIREYLAGRNACLACNSGFNPGCRDHHQFYFQDLEESLVLAK